MPGKSDGVSSTSVGDILSRLGRFGINPSLESIRKALDILGHPEMGPTTFQIVGTNGKGSTAAAIDSILLAAGYRTGRFSSPHLSDVRERILISGEMISSPHFEDLVRDLSALCNRYHLDLTFFEFLTAVAFKAFSQAGCQVFVLEAGMGGRWDATSAANPSLTVLTQVERDHEEILGKGLDRIFEEKVAVGKKGRPFVASLTDPSLRVRFLDRSREAGYLPVLNHRDFEGEWTFPDNLNGEPRPFYYRGRWGDRHLASSLTASYQIDNLLGAIAALEWSPLPVCPKFFRDGLLTLKNPGRLEQVRRNPPILLDGAHNPSAIAALCSSLEDRFGTASEFGFFVGIHASKDWKEMLGFLAIEGSAFFFPSPKTGRTILPVDGSWVNPSDLSATLQKRAESGRFPPEVREGEIAPLLREAISWAKERTGRVLVVTGSLYLVGSVRNILIPPDEPFFFPLNERDLPGPAPS